MAAFLLIVCSTAIALLGVTDATLLTVQTNEGAVRGITDIVLGEEVNTFWGIPYAEPPVGSRRFKAPKVKEGWEGTLDALEKPLSCIQNDVPPGIMADLLALNTNISEDCLYLNVWAPSSKPDRPRAVMVWIHGGAFVTGSSTLDFYDGSILAAKYDVVVVSMQYRLGLLGFLYLGTEKAPGNMGLMDQQMALRWVRNNIASFNGDPSKVTIFGESAGSASAHFHMLTPGSKGLFDNVILESGNAAGAWAFLTADKATAQVAKIIASLECDPDEDDYSCLMSKDARALLATLASGAQMSPVVDGDFIPRAPIDLLQSGDFTRANVLTGTNRDEGTIALPFMVPELSEHYPNVTTILQKSYNEFLTAFIASNDSEILEAVSRKYGVPATDATNEQLMNSMKQVVTDTIFVCPQISSIEAFVKHEVVVYEYMYAEVPPETLLPSWMGATHASEIWDVFGAPFKERAGDSAADKDFSEVLMGYWTNFAKTGNPNKGGAKVPLEWLPHTGDEYQHIVLQTPEVAMRKGYREGQCKFLEEILGPKPDHEEL